MSKKIKYYGKEIIKTCIFFISISLLIIFYLVIVDKKENYLLKYSIEYDSKLIDAAYYRLNIYPKFPETDYTRGDTSYITCDAIKECEEKEAQILKLSKDINSTLWSTTKDFIKTEKINQQKRDDFVIKDVFEDYKEVDNKYRDQILFYMGGNDELSMDLSSYRYLLNLQYLVSETSPNLLIAHTNLVNNTWNHKFNLFFSLSVVSFLVSALFFLIVAYRKSK